MHLTILKWYLFGDILDGSRQEAYLPDKLVSNYQYEGKRYILSENYADRTTILGQWFSNFNVHENPLETLLKYKLPVPIPRVFHPSGPVRVRTEHLLF